MNIFIDKNGIQQGPHSPEDIKALVERGELSLSDQVWHDQRDSWVSISDCPELLRVILPPLPEEHSTGKESIITDPPTPAIGAKLGRTTPVMQYNSVFVTGLCLVAIAFVAVGVLRNRKRAITAPHNAHAQDELSSEEQYSLGEQYLNGQGVVENNIRAAQLFRQAADQGYAPAECRLGDLAQGVTENEAEAANWYRKAAEHGNPEGQRHLGDCYLLGKGVSENAEEALKWYQEAANQNDADAEFHIGAFYYVGRVVALDRQQARIWLEKAAAQGQEDAREVLAKGKFEAHSLRCMKLIVMVNGLPKGPLELDEVKQALERSEISLSSLALRLGDDSWAQLRSILEVPLALDAPQKKVRWSKPIAIVITIVAVPSVALLWHRMSGSQYDRSATIVAFEQATSNGFQETRLLQLEQRMSMVQNGDGRAVATDNRHVAAESRFIARNLRRVLTPKLDPKIQIMVQNTARWLEQAAAFLDDEAAMIDTNEDMLAQELRGEITVDAIKAKLDSWGTDYTTRENSLAEEGRSLLELQEEARRYMRQQYKME